MLTFTLIVCVENAGPPIAPCIVVLETLTFVDVFGACKVNTWGKRLSIISPSGNKMTVAHNAKPRFNQKKPNHQPMKMKYNALVIKPCCEPC